jgi:ectoine hydroxylase-related dioxygenase (phytanoyl-CoA dioxygenase family)
MIYLDSCNTDLKDTFNNLGFIVLRNVISLQKIKEVLSEIDQVIQKEITCDPHFYFEDSLVMPNTTLLRRIEKISDYCSISDIIYSDAIQNFLKSLMGEDYLLFKDKLNLKLPGSKGFRPHVDGHYYWNDQHSFARKGWFEYGDQFINMVIPLEKSTINNGCLEVCSQVYTKRYLGNSWEEITQNLEKGKGLFVKKDELYKFPMFNIEMIPGDIAFFSWLNVHGSKDNLSSESRKIIYATYSPKRYGDNRETHVYDKIHSQQTLEEKMVMK